MNKEPAPWPQRHIPDEVKDAVEMSGLDPGYLAGPYGGYAGPLKLVGSHDVEVDLIPGIQPVKAQPLERPKRNSSELMDEL